MAISWELMYHSHRATLVPQLTMTEKGLTAVYEGVPLLVIQVLQLVYVILAFRLPFSHVNVGQNLLDYSNLCDQKEKSYYLYFKGK